MDLDAVGLAGIIHQEVLDQRQRDGQCRRCGQPGHIARGCINSVNYGSKGRQDGKESRKKNRGGRGGNRGGGNTSDQQAEARAATAAPATAAAAPAEYYNEPGNAYPLCPVAYRGLTGYQRCGDKFQTHHQRLVLTLPLVEEIPRPRRRKVKSYPLENLRISSEPRTVSAPLKALVASRAGTKVQGISGTAALLVKTNNPALHELHTRLNGKHVSTDTRRTLIRKSAAVAGDFNPNDIQELNAATFNYICEKRGLQAFVTSYAQPERLAGIAEARGLDLTEEMVNNILEGEGEQYKDSLPPGLHSFIDSLAGKAASQDEQDAALIARTIILTENFDTDAPVCEETIRRVQLAKITEEDARKFLDKADRPDKTDEETRAMLPSVYHDQIAAFQPGRANEVPPNRS
ncbi:hypothetical protein SMACR_09715 [Sordaria macrospora]|nr:hypothetical protein SMACR_09715 [Sordaria macrospora]WPJ64271.1 hypothetical protein SMAC4_09715 [Sordaria macrospora]